MSIPSGKKGSSGSSGNAAPLLVQGKGRKRNRIGLVLNWSSSGRNPDQCLHGLIRCLLFVKGGRHRGDEHHNVGYFI